MPSAPQPDHATLIKGKLPAWLLAEPASTRQALRRAGAAPLPWFEQALTSRPDTVAALRSAYARHRFDTTQLNAMLDHLPSVEAFAEPLLKAAILARFKISLDVNRTYLFNAAHALIDQSFQAASTDPAVSIQRALKGATSTLLTAALQNFEPAHAEPHGMDGERGAAGLYAAYPVQGISVIGERLPIEPHAFAALCRELDLGQRYQQQITTALQSIARPGDAPDAAEANITARFKLFEQSAFELQVHLALLKHDISQTTHQALLELARHQHASQCHFLSLFDVELSGIVAIMRDDGVTVYIPEDPMAPLKTYENAAHFTHALRDRLGNPAYQRFFARFVPARQRNTVFSRLHRTLYPLTWNSAQGLYEEVLDTSARLDLRSTAFDSDFLAALVTRKRLALTSDALFHAVPTAVQNQKAHDEKVQYALGLFYEGLNVAAFAVPALGAVMLAVTAVELCHTVYEGFVSLSRGDRDAAFSYFMDVADNLAMLALFAAAGGAASGSIPALEPPPAVAGMKPVVLPDGSSRLWQPDLAPFHHDVLLPATLKPDAQGLYHHGGKQWLPLDGRTYQVKPPEGDKPYRLVHPTRPDSYEPPLRGNGKGAWLHELDTPGEWEGDTLFRRLGHPAHDVPEKMARRIMRVSGTHDAALRRSLDLGEAPPPLLEDTLQRFKLDQALEGSDPTTRNSLFDSRYQALQHSEAPLPQLIRRSFTDLPTVVAEELVAHATPAEHATLQDQGRIPPRLAEEAQAYRRRIRLARAYEGLFLDSVHNPDSEKVKLHSLETLPGWSREVNISVRDGHFRGAELDSSGPAQAPIRKVLIKEGHRYETRDEDNGHLHGKDDLYGSVLHALPDPQRAQLGFPHTGQKAELMVAVRDVALLPRRKVEALLQTRPHEPGERSPMGLAEGRAGLPVTATGRVILQDSLLDKLRILELEATFQADASALLGWLEESGLSREAIDARLNQLLSEQQALQASLDQWAQDASALPALDATRQASRQRIGEALWHHWRANSLPELGRRNVPLHLDGVILQDFPQQLPHFIYPQVHSLELSNFSPRSPDLMSNRPLTELIAESTAQAETLGRFFGRFPQVTELRLTGSRTYPFNARQPWTRLVREHFPGLTSLDVVDMSLLIQPPEMADLRALTQLRHLDLSGNFLSGTPNFAGLELDYLGLDRTVYDARHAIAPLFDDTLLDHVSEISLRGNRLTELPVQVLANPTTPGRRTRIDVRNNPLSRATTFEALMSERTNSRYYFSVDLPESERSQLTLQRDQLVRALDDWRQASGSSSAVNVEREAQRDLTEQLLLNYWNRASANSSAPTLDLEGDISDFPLALPDFFYQRVERLALTRPLGSPAELDRLLRRFPRLESLTLYGHAAPLRGLPAAIRDMSSLHYLDLTDQGLVIDQALLDDLARITTLRGVALENNRIGTVTDGSVLRRTGINSLSLENTGLTTWPTWVNELLPRPLQALNLENNQLRAVPDYLIANARSQDHVTHINLRSNPLPDTLMQSLHVSESYSTSYTFDTDLAEYVGGSSSFGDSDSSHSSHGSPAPSAPATVEPWLTSGDVEQLAARRQVWEHLAAQGNSPHLLSLIDHLQGAADYRTAASRATLTERVWAVLEAADQDAVLRELLNATAEAPLQQLRSRETCSDGMRLAFNQMEIQVFTQRAISESPGLDRGQQLQRLARRLFRLEELDRLAIAASGSRDEAEVRLVYRLRLAAALDLPLQPSRMLYETVANVSQKELDTALGNVQNGEHGQAFLRYAATQDFWTTYLRETYAERFKVLKEEYEASVLALDDRYPEETQEQLGARIVVLEQQWREKEVELLMELTRMEERSADA
ncbi:NEL-type E3 ubiquitin ligase domain-containing protein [Pseudomonas sp. TE3610]